MITHSSDVVDATAQASKCISDGGQAILGPAFSSVVKALSPALFSSAGVAAVSYSATSPDLEDDTRFPLFARVIPQDGDLAAHGALSIVKAAGWKRIAFLHSDGERLHLAPTTQPDLNQLQDPFGRGLRDAIVRIAQDTLEADDLDLHAFGYLPEVVEKDDNRTLNNNLQRIKDTGFRIIFFAGVSSTLRQVVRAAATTKMIGRDSGFNWIGFDNVSARSM